MHFKKVQVKEVIIIIITLFQDDNIFGTNASLTYGPQIQRHTCVFIYSKFNENIYTSTYRGIYIYINQRIGK